MANIRVDLGYTIKDGTEVVFRSPVDCSAITGLIVYYPGENGATTSTVFVLADAHGSNVGDIDHLFAENVVVKVILDVTSGMAFVQNADTNAYIEKTFVKSVNGVVPDENGNVVVEGGSGGVTQETDPTVPSWAKQPQKPSYTASEVGALPNTTKIPSKTSDLTNDIGYITGYTETDPTVPAWAKEASKPSYSKNEVGLGNVDNVKQYSASNPPPYPVTSVNGKTGAVSLDASAVGARPNTWMPSASDVGALPANTQIPTVPTKVSAFTNDAGYLTEHQDLSSYAKKTDIPTKVSAFDNDKGYLTQHQDISGKLDASELPTAINTALAQAKASGEFDGQDGYTPKKGVDYFDGKDGQDGKDGRNGQDGYTPVKGVDYYTDAEKASMESYITAELAKRGQLAPEYADSVEWLNENGDQSKMYVLPDGFIHAWILTEKEVETGGGYTNLMDNPNAYIKEGYRYSQSSQAWTAYTSIPNFAAIVIPIPTSGSITVRIRGMSYRAAYPSIYGGTTNDKFTTNFGATATNTYDDNGDWYFTFSNTNGSSYMVTTGDLNVDEKDVIATVNEEIVEGNTEIITEYAWANTGLAFVPADYEGRIIDLETQSAKNTADIADLKKGKVNVTAIKDWDAPIYDANIPVFELSAEKAAITNATNTPANIYAKYDALMAKHPRYITKTDLGLCSDGVNHVYRYDFCEPEPLHESNKEWSETKAKAIIVTGIHFEWAGIYAMYNALEEIAENPNLRNFRRNTHLIVIPVANPFATIAANYDGTNGSQGVRNANGVEIHRNFEVDWVASTAGTTHYGGSAPLSEVETQYIDNVLKSNTDAAFFLSCHNCGVDTFWGTGFIWASTATKYMCNMGYRVIDKLSNAWMEKYGDALSAGIAEYKTDVLEDGETRLGWTGLSTSPGTEAKQATKYGIQGTNVEICNPFQIHGTKANPEPSMSAFTMSRGAEVYVNFLLTAFGTYDPKDKTLYG